MIPAQHKERLKGCDPKLIWRVGALINEMEYKGHGMFVLPDGGLRTTRRQQALYAKGRTKPGRVVTNCDGIIRKSYHQTGKAADCAFRVPRGGDPFDPKHPWQLYGELAKKWGLRWGGNFKKYDGPHVQLEGK